MDNIKKINGVIESFGRGSSMGNVNAKLNLVIKDDSGKLHTFKQAGALGIVGNYIDVGVAGTFHIISVGGSISLIIAIDRSDGTKISDIDAFKEEFKKCKDIKNGSNFLMFLGVITIPLLLIGFIFIMKAVAIKNVVKSFLVLSPEEVGKYLNEEGFID